MSANKKKRSDSVLGNLSEEKKAEIYSRCTERTESWPDTSFTAVRQWLADDGLETSNRALSEFCSAYALESQFREDGATTDTLLEQLKAEVPGLTEEQLDDLGQRTFSLLSIRRKDLKGFVQVRSARTNAELERAKLKLKERAEDRQSKKLKLEVTKFQFDAAKATLKYAPQIKAIATNKSLTDNQKVDQIRLKLFGETPE